MLEQAGLQIDRQVRYKRWSFDGAIAGTRILIEADGAYWHGSAKTQERDARKDVWCAENGYILLRVHELAFYKDPQAAVSSILRRAEAEGLTVERIES